ncbi:TPA: 50S ribosomal protein L7/L12 [Candidatus Berkelbacteria bacterium]|uniref:Large ribosomal subunit protein bL12 n=1 Tax=Berkelbacteria bacterium GW2011_GWE1_39_12 TaxID=1618337 RepID=A0A0G4B2R2_9BACT|nr:MAG: 50S ribosomal protein L7/L12, large subunit ribosomal protein L7/L12 [Berkelbacteria bacterium GW2011_GWE1_39_12]HBO60431.1 50S ribosomal protein L7/L12 [Candidatus Berkelbacteria bacterium]
MADDIKKEEKQAEAEAEAETKLNDEASKEEAGSNVDEKAQVGAAVEEAAGAEEETPAEVEAINTDNETAKEANEAKAEPTGKFADLIKDIEGLTTLELAELVKALEERFGVSAAAPMMAAAGAVAGGAAAPAEEEKSSYTLVLADSGSQKIAVIKALREINQELGLKEAKDLADAAPKEIKKDMPKAEAEEAKKKLEAAGAKVELK